MRQLFVLATLWIACTAQAEIYRWVDAQGNTHYSETPPGNVDSKKIGRPADAAETESELAEQAKLEAILKQANKGEPAPVLIKTSAEGVVIGSTGAAVVTLDCEKAVYNARDGVDTLITQGRKNVDAGLTDRTSNEKGSDELRRAKARISKTECQSASGDVKNFYTCMSDDYNAVAMCADKYKYWDSNLVGKPAAK